MPEPGVYSVRRVRQGLKDFLIGKGFVLVAGFLSAVMIVRFMTVADYAVYATLIGVQVFLVTLASFGLDRAITRFIPDAMQIGDSTGLAILIKVFTLWRVAGTISVLAVTVLGTHWLAQVLHADNHMAEMHLMWLYTALFIFMQHLTRTLQAMMAQSIVKWGLFSESLFRVVLLTSLIILSSEAVALWDVLVILCFSATMSILVMGIALLKLLRDMLVGAKGGVSSSHDLIVFCRENYFQSLLLLPGEAASLRILGAHFLTPAAMAAFGFFQTLTGTFRRNLPVQLMLDLIEPVMMASYSRDKDFRRLNHMTNSVLKLNLFVLSPLLAWLTFNAGGVTHLLTGGKYVELSWMLPVMVVGLMYESHWIVLRTVTNALDESAFLVKAGIWSSLGLALTVVALLSPFESKVVILVLGVVLVLMVRNAYVVGKLRHERRPYTLDWLGMFKFFSVAYFSSLLSELFIAVLGLPDLAWLSSGLLTLAIYLVAIRLFRPFNQEEAVLLLKVNRRFKLLVG